MKKTEEVHFEYVPHVIARVLLIGTYRLLMEFAECHFRVGDT